MTGTTSRKRPPPFSLWLTPDERREIENRAERAGLSMGGYCKSIIFDAPPPRRSRRPVIEKIELARLLGELGKVGSNLNQLARQINMEGAVEMPELKEALIDLAEMRAAVMVALGYREGDHDKGATVH